ncbi:hypothetical protein ACTXOY_13520 [Corynebacterium variabile]|uniref:hypothetical protein n=1 Tax=Corynebacterium variabile TaxID=1727 RepID=UPI003FD4779D
MPLIEKTLVIGTALTAASAVAGSALSTLRRRETAVGDTPGDRNWLVTVHGQPRAMILIEPDIFETPEIIAHICQDIEDIAIVRHDRAAGLGFASAVRSSVDEHHRTGLRRLLTGVDEFLGKRLPVVIIGQGLGTEFSLRLLTGDTDLQRRTQALVTVIGIDGTAIAASNDDHTVWQRLLQLDQAVFSALVGTAHFQGQSPELPDAVARSLQEKSTDGVAAVWARKEWNAALQGPHPVVDTDRVHAVTGELADGDAEKAEAWMGRRMNPRTLRRHRIAGLDGRSLLIDDEVLARVAAIIDGAVDLV